MKHIILIACCRSGHNFVRNQIESWFQEDEIHVENFEDLRPANYDIVLEQHINCGNIDPCKNEVINVVVIRDLLNWWASYLKWITKDGVQPASKYNEAFSIWYEQTQEAMFDTYNIKPLSRYIHYDYFLSSESNRRYYCETLGGRYSEDRINDILPAGGGSSFCGQTGTDMETTERYKQIMQTPLRDLYIKTLKKNRKVVKYYRDKYNPPKEQLEFLNKI